MSKIAEIIALAKVVHSASNGGSNPGGANTDGGIPSVTVSDNGKFLRVVDGEAKWAAVPNAEEASF